MEDVKRIPYGISNFVEVVEQNQYYVDKTMYLPLLEEQPSNLFFIRPRRFGKSIFLSMLRAYYDIAQKEKFDKRFGNLWIGSHPTPMQGQYQVSTSISPVPAEEMVHWPRTSIVIVAWRWMYSEKYTNLILSRLRKENGSTARLCE